MLRTAAPQAVGEAEAGEEHRSGTLSQERRVWGLVGPASALGPATETVFSREAAWTEAHRLPPRSALPQLWDREWLRFH